MIFADAMNEAGWLLLSAWLYLASIIRYVIWRNLVCAHVLAIYA